MFKENYKWQHDYARLVFDTGFCFESCKSDNFDKNKINFVDIDRLIEDRDFGTIEKFIPSITKFVLDPEQAQILDVSFVKTFRLSQLSIQYLQFCKKYLDNTLVIIREECKKVKEENKELNLFVDDLKEHIAILMREIDEKTTFKCEQCSKIFSSQEFLNSHIKRRHSFVEEAEADKLQMEIKELKGRLNSAEKMIQKEQNHEVDTNVSKEVESKKIEELQQKFEDLRLQVQSELKILQAQNNFQEKYEKLFEKMTLQSGSKSSVDRGGAGDVGRRRESTTQTDLEAVLHQASSNIDKSNFEEKNKENIPEFSNAQKQIIEFEEALETKVTSSLEKIENQMHSFWDKLNGMEMQKKKCFSQDSEHQQSESSARARVRRSIKRVSSEEDDTFNHKKINSERDVKNKKFVKVSKEVEEPGKAQTQRQINATRPERTEKVESGIHMTDLGDDDTTTSETIASETEITAESPRKKALNLPQNLSPLQENGLL
ncbi:unnamed protein product [Tenebrio molitor]|nr:unnamed protein product [Tenebrio molitor]